MSTPRLISDEEQIAAVDRAFADGAAIWEVVLDLNGSGSITFIKNGETTEWGCGPAVVQRARDLMDKQTDGHIAKAYGGLPI